MLEILEKWNRWGTNSLKSGILRQITERISDYVDTQEIIVLTGPRRSGKSTVLYQIIDILEERKIPQEAMLHINFEEPKLSPLLNGDILDKLYDCYREHIYPKGKAYLFLDEIQNVPEWERWVRSRSNTEEIKLFLTGSSAKLMSREIATILTGRHLSFEVLPLNFSEFLMFHEVDLLGKRLPISPSAEIRNSLNAYQHWGGFPAVALAKTNQHKTDILDAYFDDILYKDIVVRHSIRDHLMLRNLAIHLLTQTGNLASFQRIANVFQVSNDLATSYCSHLQEAYMIELLPYFSLKASVRQRHPHKVYALDLGLRNAVSLAHSADEGHLIETLVYLELRRHFGENVFYWSGKGEIDFVIREGTTITQLWQVVSEGLDNEKILIRELKAFEEAQKIFPKAEKIVVTKSPIDYAARFPFQVIPLWRLLLTHPTNRERHLG